MILYDFPLDYEIDNNGTYYHDPTLPNSAITWQYTVVKKGYSIPDIYYEKMYDVFIPNSDESSLKLNNSIANDLEYRSFELTGNIDKIKSRLKAGRWNPSGRIQVFDESLGLIPLEGVQVHARWSTNIKTDNTDTQGNFNMSGFLFEVNYAIKWEREDFDIRDGNWGQAWYNGPKQTGSWNLNISKGGVSWLYAHVHRAAQIYWYRNTYGIKQPPLNSFWKRKVKIGCFDESNRAFYMAANRWTTFPEICIYRFGSNSSNRNGNDIFRTTIHELAHSSHWDMNNSDFRNADDRVIESWAVGVAYFITNNIYRSDNNWQGVTFINMQTVFERKYTPLVIDLMDNLNQRANHEGSLSYPIDNVFGFTIE